MSSGIYLIKIGRHRYVGQAKDFPDRWGRHRRDLTAGEHHNIALQSEYHRGRQPKFYVLIRCPDWQLDAQEALWGRVFSNCPQRLPKLSWTAILPPCSIDGLIFLAAGWSIAQQIV